MKNSIEKKHQNKIFSPLKRINNRCSWTTWRTRAWFSTATSKIRSDFLRPTSTTRAPTTSTPPPSNASPPTPTGSSTSPRSCRQWRHCTTTASGMSSLQVQIKLRRFVTEQNLKNFTFAYLGLKKYERRSKDCVRMIIEVCGRSFWIIRMIIVINKGTRKPVKVIPDNAVSWLMASQITNYQVT